MSFEMHSSNTTFQAASCKTIIANLRELASAEDKHAKTYQKIQEALQAISYIGLKNWHSAMLQNASETAAMKRRFASSLVSNVVLPLQDHVHNYRNQTRQVFFEMRSSYEVLATRERYIKACKAAEAAIRARNTAMDKLNDLELQAKKATPSSQLPPLALLEGKKNVQGLDGLNQRIKATLDESVTAKEVYIQSDMTCRSDRSRHQNLIADMLLKVQKALIFFLETIEIQREEHLQNQVMFRVASMYQDMVTCVASSRKVLFDMSDPIFQAALESIAHFSDDFKAPDDVLTFITEQMTNDAETLAKLSDGVQTNERDATQRFQRTKRELEAKQSQMDAVEREAAEEATSPDKDKGMSLVSLGWKDSAKIRLVKLKRQMTFAKNATENFNVLFHTLVGTVHSDFIVVSGITKISTSWRTACSVTESSQLQVLRNVFGAIEAISPTSDLRLFVESQSSIHDPPNLKASTSLEFYTSDLIEMETRPPPPPSPATTTSAKLNWQHQVEFGLVLFYMFGLLALYFAMQTLRQELVHAQSVLHDQHGAVDSLEKMLREFE
ncbi:hypothetical protein B5M09_009146 [Aphanomyces astaci]|uniref:Uncharacterized protein n=1 Tax=Aphanomyces astaci TaxID=112090 RepID=A0A425CYG8_APHAT|nr:hypothetical protein B5M09_009146 [Aphanomyces astaci]